MCRFLHQLSLHCRHLAGSSNGRILHRESEGEKRERERDFVADHVNYRKRAYYTLLLLLTPLSCVVEGWNTCNRPLYHPDLLFFGQKAGACSSPKIQDSTRHYCWLLLTVKTSEKKFSFLFIEQIVINHSLHFKVIIEKNNWVEQVSVWHYWIQLLDAIIGYNYWIQLLNTIIGHNY
jgi:hypothetical protein